MDARSSCWRVHAARSPRLAHALVGWVGTAQMCGWVGVRQASLTAPSCEGSVLEEDAPSELVHHSLVCGRSSVEVSLTCGGWGVGNLGAGV